MSLNLNHSQTLFLDQVRQQLDEAEHGTKGPIVESAATHLGVSPQTVTRWLSEHLRRNTGRKRRADAGRRAVSDDDLKMISAALLGTFRKTGNRIMTFDTAVDMLRTNGVIETDLSASRLATVLTEKGLHPSQLTRPTPAIEQRSLHPNHVAQVDASVCVAYYLSNAQGLQVMDEKKFYKNKPGNVTRIQADRLIRYAMADHYTHELLTRYYIGSECSAHLADFLIWCFGQKDGHVVHGVPFIVQMDMGSANTSAPVLNLLDRLNVRVIVHERHNSRANGAVEKAHHLIEIYFESSLRFAHVADLADLNHKALMWANHFGATNVHSRYGKTRHALWMTIAQDQLRIAPDVDLMRELVTTHPISRRVSNNLTVQFAVKGHGSLDYDVRYVPGVMAGSKVELVISPYRIPAVDVGYADAETGEQRWITVEPIARADDGRRTSAPIIGEEQRSAPRGLLERQRDAVMVKAYGYDDKVANAATMTDKVAAAADVQEAGGLVFGGKVDPFKRAAEADLPAFLPKRGTALDADKRQVDVPRLNTVEACLRIRDGLARIGAAEAYVGSQVFPWIQQRFGDAGVPEDQVESICAQLAQNCVLQTQMVAPTGPIQLRAVGGGQ